jgi:hypothetical protein
VGDGEREPRAEVDDATVTAGDATKEGAASEAGGVFGNLPRSRPGTRSPRRSGARPEPAATPPPTAAQAGPAEQPPPPPPTRAREPEPSDAEAEPETASGGLEDLAWAGIAAAAEAATLGIRLANRALEAMRGTSERS